MQGSGCQEQLLSKLFQGHLMAEKADVEDLLDALDPWEKSSEDVADGCLLGSLRSQLEFSGCRDAPVEVGA